MLSKLCCSWELLNYVAQCESDTLNAPADKLLLSLFIKLGGHSAISERYPQSLQISSMKEFAQDVRDLIEATREVAIKLDNNFIGIGHFILCMNKYNHNGILNIEVSFRDKKDWVTELKGKKLEGIKDGDYTLTSQLEEGLRSSKFHCRIIGEQKVLVEHIYLGILTAKGQNRIEYVNLITQQVGRISKIKSFFINIYFNQVCRKLGLVKLLWR